MQAHNRAGDEEGCSSGGSQPSKQLCHAESGEEDDGVAERTTDEHGNIGGKGMRAHDAQGDEDGIAKDRYPAEKPHPGAPTGYQSASALHVLVLDAKRALQPFGRSDTPHTIATDTSKGIACRSCKEQ